MAPEVGLGDLARQPGRCSGCSTNIPSQGVTLLIAEREKNALANVHDLEEDNLYKNGHGPEVTNDHNDELEMREVCFLRL